MKEEATHCAHGMNPPDSIETVSRCVFIIPLVHSAKAAKVRAKSGDLLKLPSLIFGKHDYGRVDTESLG